MRRTTFGTEAEALAAASLVPGTQVIVCHVPEVHDQEYRIVTFWRIEAK